MSARWDRIAGLNRVLRAAEKTPISAIGSGAVHNSNGSPCCVLGHAIGPVPVDPETGAPIKFYCSTSAGAKLRISEGDTWAIVFASDSYAIGRKKRIVSVVRHRIAAAVRGGT